MAWPGNRKLLAAALALVLVEAWGCHSGSLPRIDPSGEHIFVPGPAIPQAAGYQPQPGPLRPHQHTRGVTVTPCKVVAPVGSEVVMLAGICGLEGNLLANQRVEWMLAPGGVGQFVAPGGRTALDWLLGFRTWPRKIDNTYAVGTTSSRYLCLTRGTPDPLDDVAVLRGQAWISVTSPVEGTSYVTAYAPSVYGWDSRQQTATIQWVDAQWQLPVPAINPLGGRHVFTTIVSRHSTQMPAAGWRVRYEISGGPPAAFAPDGAQAVEVTTDSLGQASAEIYQLEPMAGTNTVAIQIIRPAELGGGETMVVGTGATQKTWTAPAPPATLPPAAVPPVEAPLAPAQPPERPAIEVRIVGPDQATVGQEVSFEITATNRGTMSATQLIVVDRYDAGFAHVTQKNPIERELGTLEPGASRTLSVTFRVLQPGRLCHTIEIHGPATGPLASAQACLTATEAARAEPAARPRLAVKKTGPARRRVGEVAEFVIEVSNTGQAAATNVKVADNYDLSLDPVQATDGYAWTGLDLVWTLDTLPAGRTVRFQVHCRCLEAAPRSCNRVTVTSAEGSRADGEACLAIAAAAGRAADAAGLSLTITDLRDPVAVNNQTTYEVRVANNSQAADRQMAVVVTVPEEMTPLLVGSSGPAPYKIEGQQVRFEPVREIRPGETLTYRVLATARRPGAGRAQVQVTSTGAAQPLAAEETTTIVEGGGQ